VAHRVSIVVVEVEVTIKEVIKATVAEEEVAEATNPEDPPQIPKKNPSSSMQNTISTKQMMNLKNCLKAYRKVRLKRKVRMETLPKRPQLSLKKAKLNLKTMNPHLCPNNSMTKRSLSLTAFPAKPQKNPKTPVLGRGKTETQNSN